MAIIIMLFRNRRICLSALLFLPLLAMGQSSYIPLNDDYYQRLDRYEVKSGHIFPQIFTGVKQYKRSDAVDFIDSAFQEELMTSKADLFNRDYFLNDSWEWARPETNESKHPAWNTLYKKKSDLLYVDTQDFDLHVNPVIYFGVGNDTQRDSKLFINTRGVELRGMIDKKVGFYTYLTDNQARLPGYVADYQSQYWVIPHEGFWKSFKKDGVDFLQARGYITVDATKHINLQLGYDRFTIGNGYRSLILSDFAPPSVFFKIDVKVWKLNYLFLINQMEANAPGTTNGSKPKSGGYDDKFTAFHHLSLNIGKKLNVGIFETVIFSPDDTLGSGRFEFGYLNPIIFYRAIEQQNGSSDNVVLGFDFKWNAVKRLSFYGQFILDEFVLSNIKAGNGWWANKFGIQGGLKYVDAFGVPNLDVQGELNIMRPYTYTHNTNYANYTSFMQPLAHPLGANFEELIGIVRYQPLPRLSVTGKMILTKIGRDPIGNYGVNFGSDLNKNNTTKEKDYGNTIGQGIPNNILFGSFTASWMLKHNLFLDAQLIKRNSKNDEAFYNTNTTTSSISLRWNIAQRLYEF